MPKIRPDYPAELHVRIPAKLRERIEIRAQEQERTLSDVVRRGLEVAYVEPTE